jgi:hypothetical protein
MPKSALPVVLAALLALTKIPALPARMRTVKPAHPLDAQPAKITSSRVVIISALNVVKTATNVLLPLNVLNAPANFSSRKDSALNAVKTAKNVLLPLNVLNVLTTGSSRPVPASHVTPTVRPAVLLDAQPANKASILMVILDCVINAVMPSNTALSVPTALTVLHAKVLSSLTTINAMLAVKLAEPATLLINA